MSEMKYVVLKPNDKEMIFIFPKSIDHDRFVETMESMRYGSRGNWERLYPNPISAGFTDGKTCFGRSETLNLDSRKEIDSFLLRSQS